MRMFDVDEFKQLVEKYVALEQESGETRVHVYGATYQRPRLVETLRYCFECSPGDAIEIGSMGGGTSVLLADTCRQFGRRLVCVDPWKNYPEFGWVDFAAHYQIFLDKIAPYKELVDIVRLESQDPVAISQIQQRRYAFAFVDGDHRYKPALTDLRTVLPVTDCVVASDDHRYDTRVQRANARAAKESPDWQFQAYQDFREAWFIRVS